MKRRILFTAGAAALMAGTVSTGGALAQETLTFGASAPKTGGLAGGAAVTYWPAIHLWEHDVNERGGIDVGGEMRPVEIVEYDDGTSNEKAIQNIQRLINVDNADFIIPPYGTGINLATAPVIANAGFPHIAVTAVTDGVDEFAERWPNTFWTLGTSTAFAESLVDVLVDMREAGQIGDKVAVVNVSDAFGIELANAGKPALEEAGFEIVYESSYPLSQQDFAPIISSAQNAEPEAFVAFSYPPDTFGLTEQAAIADLDVNAFYVGVATAFPAFLGANGDAAQGVMGAGGVDANSEEYQDFRERHIEVTGEEPDYWASAVQYASLQVLEQAITEAGTTDKQAVIDAIKQGTFDTIMGEWTFQDNVIRDYWTVGQWQDGVFHGIGSTGVGGEVDPIVKDGWE